ncbi:transglutaminase family protein [Nocardioides sp. TRM66260-LWL]|uniref:transglutaminase family protein n=1 Tax=Nocardioides sp. TRM66260-LWL TaxID=2874478 RepID=UPI001CC50181|nr:transglutaminase family protein [Nocardioides sp. TRM66260-LWL]MBZ5733680.1 transglutaminase family protein [Nocardioides sp. TRM66260-LWL]
MQLRIVHRTTIGYDGRAAAAHHQARLTPPTTPEQIVVHTRIEVSPTAYVHEYRDYFGTLVTAFEISEPHDAMTVVATSTVQTQRTAARTPAPPPTLAWADLDDREVADRWTEYLVLDEPVAPDDAVRALAEEVRAGSATPGHAARGVCERLHAELDLTTPIPVSQVVHRALGALRHLGVPARYVSGYFHPHEQPAVGETVRAHAHAWLEWWDAGWQAFDPTNALVPDDRFVTVAAGRDLRDVKPVAGIWAGAETTSLSVEVDVTRLA